MHGTTVKITKNAIFYFPEFVIKMAGRVGPRTYVTN